MAKRDAAAMTIAMTILAFDTSAGGCSAAVLRDDGMVAAVRRRTLARGHAELLMPMVRDVLAEAAIPVAALDLIAVTTGPGAFTGIRIGLAAARGLALAGGIPLLGVTSFAAVAAALDPAVVPNEVLLVAIDSRRGDVFAQEFAAGGAAVGAPWSGPPERLADYLAADPVVVAGDAAFGAAQALVAAGRNVTIAAESGPPDAVAIARLARATWRPEVPPEPVRPFYMRAPDVTLPGRRR